MLMPKALSRFLDDRRASIVPLFALTIIPVIGFVGAAVDYSRANSVKAAMQAALDSTGLMLSKEAGNLTADQITQKANQYFQALFNRPEANSIQLTPQLTPLANGGYKLDVSGQGWVDTTFARVIGQTSMKVTASTQIVWGFKKLELALALDNTGSMGSSGKMTALKSASHSLINILKKASKNPGDIKVSIVPFDTTVRVGSSYKSKNWFDWETYNQKQSDWEGCVVDRDQPHDAKDSTPKKALFPAVQCGSLVTAMPLTSDWDLLHSRIDQMTPNGNTNVTIGLVWGWHALTSNNPYNEAAAADPELDKVVLILTDGDNTQNRWSTKESTINARTTEACNNIKAAGIKIYSVRVIEGNATLLKDCATNPSMYYDVKQASELDAVFTSIAEALANLRIAR